ncbi:hypothetical protein I5677_05090 [Mobilitalea sibirica]|uniref:Uncharacterized protein n=1 Tax=Mobilitalea sibirica TaxID=1462919 RepID=A0A8J7HAS8_9FIRM|nr:hypothetical protein [Mobilitalea sibirica]MBH1940271.1 hypothetical protein [Mobilitalea sibirica]
MDKMNDNKGTPTKRTGLKNNSGSMNTSNESGSSGNEVGQTSEYNQPNPSIASPSIPDEMPARDVR